MNFIFLIAAILLQFFICCVGYAETENCKLIVQSRLGDGRKRVEVIASRTETREECQGRAKERVQARELSSIESSGYKVQAAFGWIPFSE